MLSKPAKNDRRPISRGRGGVPVGVSMRSPSFCAWRLLERNPQCQIYGVIVAGVASGAIVIGAGAVKSEIAGIGQAEIDILQRPIARLDDIAVGVWAA